MKLLTLPQAVYEYASVMPDMYAELDDATLQSVALT